MGYRDGNFRMQVSVSTIGAVGDAVKAAGGKGWDNVDDIIEGVNMNKNLFVYCRGLRLSYSQDDELFNRGGLLHTPCEFIFHTTFIEGLRVECQAEKLRHAVIEPMKGAAVLAAYARISPSISRMVISSTPWNRDDLWEQLFTGSVSEEPFNADSAEAYLIQNNPQVLAEILGNGQKDLDTEIDEKIQEALGSPDAHRPLNIFEEKKQLKRHVEKNKVNNPFQDTILPTEGLEGLENVYRRLELEPMEPVKQGEEEFIRCLELD